MVLAISGIILFAYSDGFGSASLLGVCLAVLSAVGAALYKVWVGLFLLMRDFFSTGILEEESGRCRSISDVAFSQFTWII